MAATVTVNLIPFHFSITDLIINRLENKVKVKETFTKRISDINTSDERLFLLGTTQAGKTSLLKAIVGKQLLNSYDEYGCLDNLFIIGDGENSCTRNLKEVKYTINGQSFCFIDTPGMLDTRGIENDDSTLKSFCDTLENFDSFKFIVLTNSRMNKGAKAYLRHKLDILGINSDVYQTGNAHQNEENKCFENPYIYQKHGLTKYNKESFKFHERKFTRIMNSMFQEEYMNCDVMIRRIKRYLALKQLIEEIDTRNFLREKIDLYTRISKMQEELDSKGDFETLELKGSRTDMNCLHVDEDFKSCKKEVAIYSFKPTNANKRKLKRNLSRKSLKEELQPRIFECRKEVKEIEIQTESLRKRLLSKLESKIVSEWEKVEIQKQLNNWIEELSFLDSGIFFSKEEYKVNLQSIIKVVTKILSHGKTTMEFIRVARDSVEE